MADLLFRSARDVLMTMLADPRHLGARPGILAALHTWSRTLVLHPHVHLLVTGGGLTPEGRWKPVRNGFLLPVRAVRKLYRGMVLGQLGRWLQADQLALPPDLDREAARAILQRAAAKKWSVRIKERYPYGRGVVTYLARYVRGGPLKNGRLERFDGREVTFRYGDLRERDSEGRPTTKRMTLPVAEFLRRVLLHVPLPGQRVVRRYGLFHHTQRADFERCRELLAGTLPTPTTEAPSPPPAIPAVADPDRCPVCGRRLVVTEVLPRSGAPPPALVREAA
jgi:hypothetical protein